MKFLLTTIITFVLLTSFGVFKGPNEKITASYLLLKDRLVVSDSLAASGYALTLSEELDKLTLSKKQLKASDSAATTKTNAAALAKAIAATHNINKQRKFFADLSVKVWVLLETDKAPARPLYKQVCPMTGVSWISKDTVIKNPYYPKNMLNCGNVTQVIGAK